MTQTNYETLLEEQAIILEDSSIKILELTSYLTKEELIYKKTLNTFKQSQQNYKLFLKQKYKLKSIADAIKMYPPKYEQTIEKYEIKLKEQEAYTQTLNKELFKARSTYVDAQKEIKIITSAKLKEEKKQSQTSYNILNPTPPEEQSLCNLFIYKRNRSIAALDIEILSLTKKLPFILNHKRKPLLDKINILKKQRLEM